MAPMNIKINPLGGAVCIVFLLCTFLYMFGLPAWLGRHEERISMKELLSAGIVLARRGGDRVREIRRHSSLDETVKSKTAEGANELKTKGDIESHRTIVHGFSKAFPGLAVNKITLDHGSVGVWIWRWGQGKEGWAQGDVTKWFSKKHGS